MKRFKSAVRVGLLVSLPILLAAASVTAATPLANQKLQFGTSTGVVAKTIDGTVFSLGLHADYFASPSFSIGPMGILNSGNSLIQSAVAVVGRYHIRTEHVNFVPFAGVGFIHADMKADNASAFYAPAGVTLEYPIRGTVLTGTAMVNSHSLDFGPGKGEDPKSFALLFGVRFDP